MIAYRTDELPHNARRYASSFAAPPRSAEPVLRAETGVEPDWETGAFASLKQSVLDSAARIAASPFIMRKDSVRGFVFDVETGALREIPTSGHMPERMSRRLDSSGPISGQRISSQRISGHRIPGHQK
jgi:hypothetical protein